MGILSAVLAHADPCAYDAARLALVVDGLRARPIAYADDRLTLSVRGGPSCGTALRIEAMIDEDAVHALAPSDGSVLSAAARLDGDTLTVRFTGSTDLRTRLAREWRESGTLRRFVSGLTLRWYANYASRVITERPGALADVRRACRPGYRAAMTCAKFAEWTFETVPACLADAGRASRVRAGVFVEDPFVGDQNAKVRVRGVTRNLCGGLYAPETTWLDAVANQLLFGESDRYQRATLSAPSLIEVRGEISW